MAYRKLRGDLIEAYKMYTKKYDESLEMPINKVSDIHNKNTRGSNSHLVKDKSKTPLRASFFKNRIVPFWNELPRKVIEAPSTKSFEKRLDKYWRKYNIKYDYDKCVEFERQRTDPNFAGTGARNLKFTKEEDLEIQDLE